MFNPIKLLPALAVLLSQANAKAIPCTNTDVSTYVSLSPKFTLRFTTSSGVWGITGYNHPLLNPFLESPILQPFDPESVIYRFFYSDGFIINDKGFILGRNTYEDRSFNPKSLYFGTVNQILPLVWEMAGDKVWAHQDNVGGNAGKGLIVIDGTLKVQLVETQRPADIQVLFVPGSSSSEEYAAHGENKDASYYRNKLHEIQTYIDEEMELKI